MNKKSVAKNHKKGPSRQGEIYLKRSSGDSRREDASPDDLRFERLISDLSARFVNIAADQVDGEIESALTQVLEFFQVDRCGLLGLSSDRKRVHVTHAAYAEGIERVSGDIDLADLFPWSYEKLVIQGRHVNVPRMLELPPEAETDRQTWGAMGVQSSLTIPLFIEGEVSFLIVINSMRQELSRPEEYVPRLRLMGEIFINALERKRADQALRESEARLQLATDSAGAGLWSMDVSTSRVWVTAKTRELFCFSPEEEITYGSFDERIHPEDRGQVREEVQLALQTGAELRVEYRIVCPDGSLRWIAVRGRPKYSTSGSVERLMGASVDITERRHMQDQLRTAADEWHRTFNTIQDMIMIMDREFRIVQVNDAVMKFFGLPKEKIIGAECFRLMHGTEDPLDGCPYKKMLETKEHEETEVYDELRGRWFHVGVDPLFGAKGDIVGVVHTVKDITEYKCAWVARMESMERYQAVVEAYDGFIYICSPDYRIEFMNQRLIGRTGRNAVGEMCYRVLHDRDSVCPWCVNEQVFRGETVRWEVQSPKDDRWYYVVNTPIRRSDGTIAKQSMIVDITERKQAEEALRESEAALRNSQRDLRKLAGRLISAQEEELSRLSRELHDDLTQRLAVLAIEAGKLELGLSKVPESCPEIQQKISQMKEQLIRVSEEVHRISRQLHPTILDDLGLVRAIESECAALMRRQNVRIIFRREDGPEVIPKDVSLCLYRIVQEGLKNVTTHSRAESCEIFLRRADDGICLTITDGGVGFDPLEVRQKPGLGLASMRERIRLAHGDFSITSQPGKGTVISVWVPLAGDGA